MECGCLHFFGKRLENYEIFAKAKFIKKDDPVQFENS